MLTLNNKVVYIFSVALLLAACSPESEISISETEFLLEESDRDASDFDISQAPSDILNFVYDFDQLDDETHKRISIGRAVLAVSTLENTDRYKIVVVNEIIGKYVQEKNSSISAHLHYLIEDYHLYEVELSEENRNLLNDYLDTLDPRNASAADIFLLAAFNVEGVDTFLRDVIDFQLAMDNKTSIGELANLERYGDGIGPQLWTALKMRARHDEESLNTVLSIMESTSIWSRPGLFDELEVINTPQIKSYLASYVFSDEQVIAIVDAGTGPGVTQYIAWPALLSFAKIEVNLPFQVVYPGAVNQLSKNKAEVRPIILDARDWLIQQPEYDFVKEFNLN